MRLDWVIDDRDVAMVKDLLARSERNSYVQLRRQRNLDHARLQFPKSDAWTIIIGCLLTTQQKSGPGSAVHRFVERSPLSYEDCLTQGQSKLKQFALNALSESGGIRRSTIVATQIAENFRHLEEGCWDTLLGHAADVRAANSAERERKAAKWIADTLDGFGPKQSRNFLQWFGVSRYEIPIDSRMTKWLNENLQLAPRLDATMLSSPTYYDLASDGIIQLCAKADEYPCMFDAAVFASFEKSSGTVPA